MNVYAGLDVSLNETSICVVDGEGTIVDECKVPSEPDAVDGAIDAWIRGNRHRVSAYARFAVDNAQQD